jgi:hypothetical protein
MMHLQAMVSGLFAASPRIAPELRRVTTVSLMTAGFRPLMYVKKTEQIGPAAEARVSNMEPSDTVRRRHQALCNYV